ncbi:MAG: phosphoribosylanthranilate isomerase [Melioribacteraceae bacterium]
MKIKICGITNYEDAKIASDLGADAIGFIFYKNSKRFVSPENVKNIVDKLPPFLTKVGVFVNEEADIVNQIMKSCKLNIAQLHGDENLEYIYKINYPIVKALRVSQNYDYNILSEYSQHNILLDTYNDENFGGTGESFKWENIPFEIKQKIILAGGVSENNLEEIFHKINPYAIDVSSSLEILPGKKDHERLIKLFWKLNELRKEIEHR